jgi:hypothetical protein
MQFLIADSFTDSLVRLTSDEQKAVKTTAFDLQLNPAKPGHKLHKLDKAKDKNFWSVRVNDDIRLMVHRSDNSLLLCYVGHHDKAYEWARRRKLETHPKTGAAQMVILHETVQEIVVPVYTELSREPDIAEPKRIFADFSDDDLLGCGVPEEWLPDVKLATEDSLLRICVNLPDEASEALLQLATNGTFKKATSKSTESDPFAHPDAQRRFRVMSNVEELERALEYPWEKWIIFLHPDQKQLVERGYSGPARVAGSAGTGKTIVALHRAVYLARKHSDSRVLLTTFSESLSNALKSKLNRLVSHEPRLAERIDVQSLESLGLRLYRLKFGAVNLFGRDQVRALIKKAAAVSKQKFNAHFLVAEWEQVVDAWQLETWESYRDVPRLGRKTRLPGVQREQLWLIYHEVMEELKRQKAVTLSGMFTKLAKSLSESPNKPYEFAVVDEAQDIGIAQLKFFAAFGADRPDTLFFAGDQGQRIFQQPFSWKSLGVDIRGRSRMLKVNYRTSHQIRMKADLLLDPELTDVDGNIEDRSLTVSVFNGPAPLIKTFDDADEEVASNALWLKTLGKDGLLPHEIGVFVRSESELDRAKAAVKQAGLAFSVLDDHVNTISGKVSICTMHLAKGLEFRAVLVMACDDEVIPQQERIETVGDDADLKEVHDTERQLLYVACTRARDHLLVTGVEPSSEFLEDMCV